MAEDRTWYNYVPLADAGPIYKDDGNDVILSIWLDDANGEKTEIALIGNEHTISLIRVATPNSDGNLSLERQKIIGNLVEHMMAVLRLSYDPSSDRVRSGENFISLGNFSHDGQPSLNFNLLHHVNQEFRVNTDKIKGLFTSSVGLRRLLTLITDAGHPGLPIPFRYLSLYKVLELEFRDHGTWIGLDDILNTFESEFQTLNLSKKKLSNFLHYYRDRCAHVKTGHRNEIGLTGLESDDLATVRSFMPLFTRIVVQAVNNRYKDRFVLGC